MATRDAEGPLPLPVEARGEAPGRGRLTDRRILVVGAGTRASDDPAAPVGNGRAIAILAAREGARVACADLDAESARETLTGVEAEGSTGVVIEADASHEPDVERMMREAVAGLGGLDGLVLNVGIGGPLGLENNTADIWDQVLAVNLRAHFLGAKHGLPALEPGGAVLFISSIAGVRAGSRMPAYDASKAALDGLCRHVGFEAADKGVRANVLMLGLIDTPLGRLATAGRPGRARTPVPLKRQGTAWEVAHAAVFLLSNEASYVNGQRLIVDGGLTTLR